MATLTYAYSESTAVVAPLAPVAEPHSWDLCETHAGRLTAPVGWDMLRVDRETFDRQDGDVPALAQAMRRAKEASAGQQDTGQDTIGYPANHDYNDPSTSPHPVHRNAREEEERQERRSHLQIVPTPENEQGEPADRQPEP